MDGEKDFRLTKSVLRKSGDSGSLGVFNWLMSTEEEHFPVRPSVESPNLSFLSLGGLCPSGVERGQSHKDLRPPCTPPLPASGPGASMASPEDINSIPGP